MTMPAGHEWRLDLSGPDWVDICQRLAAVQDITAQRDRLLRYVRAEWAVDVTLDDDTEEAGRQFAAQIVEMHAARQALIDAGDITGDDE